MIYITSDLHFFHNKIIELSQRPFSSTEEMTELLVDEWNKTVRKNDTIYHAGDLTLDSVKQEEIEKLLLRLNGTIVLLRGNHCAHVLSKMDKSGFFERNKRIVYVKNADIIKIRHKKRKFIVCHYPLMTWEGINKGVIHLHGHSHGRIKDKPPYFYDIGWDILKRIRNLDEFVDLPFLEMEKFNGEW